MKEIDFYKRTHIISEDGSSTLRIDGVDEHFHSIHGAYNESMHIYIQTGLWACDDIEDVSILEVGFGTGLNAILTQIHQGGRKIHYHGIEAYPLKEKEIEMLNYSSFLNDFHYSVFRKMHEIMKDEEIEISPNLFFRKSISKVEDISFPDNYYDLVYFDAFSPDIQPEMWQEEIFQKLYKSMRTNGILVTYCAKGWVKRAMKSAGFQVEGVPGPVGKREISRASKKSR